MLQVIGVDEYIERRQAQADESKQAGVRERESLYSDMLWGRHS